MGTPEIDNISALISKVMLGTATAEEKMKLNEWRASSERNAVVFERIAVGKGFGKRLVIENNLDIESGLKIIKNKLQQTKNRRRYIRVASVAASMLLLAGLGINLWSPPVPETYSAFNGEGVQPGKVQAVLIADGQEIQLDKTMKLSIGAGTVVSDESGNHIYSSTETVSQGIAVSEKRIFIPRGGEYSLTLADGTKIWLNSETQIRFPDRFDPAFREITIDGEAYLEVAHNPEVPFYVNVNHLKVHVTGTSFVVCNYSNEENISVSLLEGGVRMESPGGSTLAALTPMKQFTMDKLTRVTKITAFDTDKILDWKNKLFIFDDEELGSIARRLERWYDIEIEVDPSLKTKRYYGRLDRHENLEPIIFILTNTGDMEVVESAAGKIVIKPTTK